MRIRLTFFFFLFFLNTNAQKVKSLNDSIRKYTVQDPQKALEFGFKAIAESEFNNLTWALYDTNYLIGQTLFYLKLYKDSFEFLFQALNVYESLPDRERLYKNIIKPPWILITLGNVFYNNDELDKANAYYVEAIKNFELFEDLYYEDKLFGLNTAEGNLAMISIKRGEFDKAFLYYNKILDRRKSIDKKSDIIFSYTQFLNLYLQLNDEEKALQYLDLIENVYRTESQHTGFSSDSEVQLYYSIAVSNYASYKKDKNEFGVALELFTKVKELAFDFSYEIPTINISIAECYIGLGENQKAERLILANIGSSFLNNEQRINNYKVLSTVYKNLNKKDDLIRSKDSLLLFTTQYTYPYNKLDNLENIILLAEKQRELNRNQFKFNLTIFLFVASLLILILLLFLLRINFNLQKERSSRLELEKNKIEEELSAKKRELFSKTNFILQRNEYLQKFKNKLENQNASTPSINRLKKEISTLINSESTYQEFDKKFVEVFPDFYKKLNQQFTLSKIDFRLIAYIKMNKSNNEIAQISGISLRTVQSQRYRLAKKLKLHKNQDLNSFIFSI